MDMGFQGKAMTWKNGRIRVRSLGIAVNLLHEASGHVVTVELKSLLRKHD
ncbi:hypothetical protein JHK82_031175 [Glycine max]|nr:hypothetical protein JHK85_031822 [Glycine max]KAG5124438.1 hypothetical protein JHK82_031175 [Glycine max]